jgi:hypothetical protein
LLVYVAWKVGDRSNKSKSKERNRQQVNPSAGGLLALKERSASALLLYEENIPRPAPNACAVTIIHFRAITKKVAVLISSWRFLVVETDRINPKLLQGMKLACLRDAIVIRVLPEPQRSKDGIRTVNYAVIIASVWRFVVLR